MLVSFSLCSLLQVLLQFLKIPWIPEVQVLTVSYVLGQNNVWSTVLTMASAVNLVRLQGSGVSQVLEGHCLLKT